jgi:hypothetical protein
MASRLQTLCRGPFAKSGRQFLKQPAQLMSCLAGDPHDLRPVFGIAMQGDKDGPLRGVAVVASSEAGNYWNVSHMIPNAPMGDHNTAASVLENAPPRLATGR